jgi:hypothetical protein
MSVSAEMSGFLFPSFSQLQKKQNKKQTGRLIVVGHCIVMRVLHSMLILLCVLLLVAPLFYPVLVEAKPARVNPEFDDDEDDEDDDGDDAIDEQLKKMGAGLKGLFGDQMDIKSMLKPGQLAEVRASLAHACCHVGLCAR